MAPTIPHRAIPSQLHGHKHAGAYYGIVQAAMLAQGGEDIDAGDLRADIAIRIEEILDGHRIRDWTDNLDVPALMKNDSEDYLYSVKGCYDLTLTWNAIDHILAQLIHTSHNGSATGPLSWGLHTNGSSH